MAEATSKINERDVGEELEQLSLGTRSRKASRMLNQGEVRSERARELKLRKSGHLGDIKQKIERVDEALANDLGISWVEQSMNCYEIAFKKFIDAHEKYLDHEDDEERRLVAIDVYNNQKDINVWYKGSANRYYDRKNKERRLSGAKSVSSVKSSSRRSNASLCSSKRSSVKERMRQMEEVKLRMQILEDKQRIEREIEEEEYQLGIRKLRLEREVAKNKSEKLRKLELLEVEGEVKLAETNLQIEREDVESRSLFGRENNATRSQNIDSSWKFGSLDAALQRNLNLTTQDISPTGQYTSSSIVKDPDLSVLQNSTSLAKNAKCSGQYSFEQINPLVPNVTWSCQHTKPSIAQNPNPPVLNVARSSQYTNPSSVRVPSFPVQNVKWSSQHTNLLTHQSSTAPSRYIYPPTSQNVVPTDVQDITYQVSVYDYRPVSSRAALDHTIRDVPQAIHAHHPVHHQPYLPSSQSGPIQSSQLLNYPSDPWMTIAEALRQGPSLPKVELMKFSGDPAEYTEFVTNFQDNIESQVRDNSQRLTRLLAQCEGKAKEAIKSCVSLPLHRKYNVAWETLRKHFGQPHMITNANIKKMKDIQLRKADASSLMEFARKLEDVRRTLASLGQHYVHRLDNEDTIKQLMNKLPTESLKRKWADRAGDLVLAKGEVKFGDFIDFVEGAGNRLNTVFGEELSSSLQKRREETRNKYFINEIEVDDVSSFANQRDIKGPEEQTGGDSGHVVYPPCSMCSGKHGIWRCEIFKGFPYSERMKVVADKKLCRRCLETGHFVRTCRRRFLCRVQGCGQKHHDLIHPPNEQKDGGSTEQDQTSGGSRTGADESKSSPETNKEGGSLQAAANVTVGVVGIKRPRVCFKVIPVKVSSGRSAKEIVTYAFLDCGSDTSLCLNSLVEELEAQGRPVEFTMTTANFKGRQESHETELTIQALDGSMKFEIDNVLTVDDIPVDSRHFASNKDLKKWPHLSGVHLPEIDIKKVTVLIGNDCPEIVNDILESKWGERGEPVAIKTPLGWTVCGPMGVFSDRVSSVNFTRTDHEMEISTQLQRLYDTEFNDRISGMEEGLSVEDRKAKKIMDESACLVDGHYQIKLPFRRSEPVFPESRRVAERRIRWLKGRFERDPVFKEKYKKVLEDYEEEGSSRQVSDEELRRLSPIWYLPHHAVWHQRKPSEPRVVFDCASKSGGSSLNDELLQGTLNTSTLLGVILRFRVNKVAVAADIKRMFHQVRVAPEDSGALCYLWWPDGDTTKELVTYQMLVHLFGATSSPSVCGYALRKTALDNKNEFSEDVVEAVLRDFYVDDLIKSFTDSEKAIMVSKEIQDLLSRGGFRLTKWISNDRSVLTAFPAEDRAPAVKDLDLEFDSLPVERALGIQWNVEQDMFNLVVSGKSQPENRRGVLSSIATVYDPLGFASPLLLPGREINQELCKLKYDWNDDLPFDILERWRTWKRGLLSLEEFGISRCFKPPDFGIVTRTELHHFADASVEHGYGTVSYLRFVNQHGRVHCSFVYGKSRVKPLRSGITVPKMELTAATVLISVNDLIMRELSGRLQVDCVIFWTDSVIVLRYILNETKRFVTFVSNRIAKIREGSDPSQWRHVKSELNPADLASRGIKASETRKLERWTNGPEFLWQMETEWPQQPADLLTALQDDDEGVRKDKVNVNTTMINVGLWSNVIERYSRWNRVRRVAAWILRAYREFRRKLRSGRQFNEVQIPRVTGDVSRADTSTDYIQSTSNLQKNLLTVIEVEEAEKTVLRFVQQESFPQELDRARRLSGAYRKGSSLSKLKPFVEEGILRVGGRLNRVALSREVKHQIILPARHRVTEMIIRDFHQRNGHIGIQQTLAESRQRYWIVNGVSTVRRVLRTCQVCRRLSGKLGEQITAPLPEIRVTSDKQGLIYPFAAVGIDYFGPFSIHVGPNTRAARKNPKTTKRYGCIFTCLRYRAVHLEVANDLSTDSFINAVIRFVARRGPPRVIYSDNGTNFHGAEPDVIKALKSWDQEKIQGQFLRREIQWHFNPPAASHQGGVWERLIRSLRRILSSMVGDRLLNDETLRTFLTEVEKIMNDRPLTRVSDDVNDLEALTPNHILLLRQNSSSASAEIKRGDQYAARWKYVNILANEFWSRWMKEYVPTLQERQRWLQKRPNFKKGQLVLMADKSLPRGKWSKAIVESVFPDIDGVVREVSVRTATGIYRRDIRKLCLLEEDVIVEIERKS